MTVSRFCDKALALDYYEMLTRKSQVEKEIREVLTLSCETEPAAQANLKCQFPNHETLLNKLQTCAKLVVRKYLEPTILMLSQIHCSLLLGFWSCRIETVTAE